MSENSEKLSWRVKRYLKNLAKALFGLDPYREELAEARGQLEKASANLSSMQDQLYAALDRWDGCQMQLEMANEALETIDTAACRQLRSMQRLVENLRGRIKEKDADLEQQGMEFRERMERVKHEYQQRIVEYDAEIEKLRNRE